MLTTTQGIVLHHVKYGETSIIATIYTQVLGRQSYMIHAARSKKAKNKVSFFQPLFLTELETLHRSNKNLQTVKSIKPSPLYQNIPFDIEKSTQTIFLAEILYKTLKEQEQNKALFNFIKNSLLYFDLMDNGQNNFHIYFLLQLTEYLGFYPKLNLKSDGYLDLQQGEVIRFEPAHPLYADKNTTAAIKALSALKISELKNFSVTAAERKKILETLLAYYQLHFEHLSEIKSLKILQEVFS